MTGRSPWALALLSLVMTSQAGAVESPTSVFATSFFSPEDGDPDPSLTGVLEIDLATGATTTFIAESAATGFQFPSDLAVDESTNTLYVSTLTGFIFHFDATTGAPLDSLVPGPAGAFAALPTEQVLIGDGYNSLLAADGTLLAATAFGSIEAYDLPSGGSFGPVATGLAFPSGLDMAPNGDLIVATGDPFGGPGAIVSINGSGGATTLVDYTDTPGIQGAGNPTVVYADGDFDVDGDVDDDDFNLWAASYGGATLAGDANGDGAVNAADYTIFREQFGDEARVVVTDLFANRLMDFALDGSDGGELAILPPDIPDPLPPTADPNNPSNSPSEVLVTDQGTLLVSTLGLTRRPDNRGSLLEFDRNGTLLRTIASDLPPLSGVAFAPRPMSGAAIPEPTSVAIVAAAGVALTGRRGGRR